MHCVDLVTVKRPQPHMNLPIQQVLIQSDLYGARRWGRNAVRRSPFQARLTLSLSLPLYCLIFEPTRPHAITATAPDHTAQVVILVSISLNRDIQCSPLNGY